MSFQKLLFLKLFLGLPKMAALRTIKFYQRYFSPDHGPFKFLYPEGYCKFHPSCSMYTYEAVEKLGLIRGLLLGCYRIFRCNPWNKGGYDPVPKK